MFVIYGPSRGYAHKAGGGKGTHSSNFRDYVWWSANLTRPQVSHAGMPPPGSEDEKRAAVHGSMWRRVVAVPSLVLRRRGTGGAGVWDSSHGGSATRGRRDGVVERVNGRRTSGGRGKVQGPTCSNQRTLAAPFPQHRPPQGPRPRPRWAGLHTSVLSTDLLPGQRSRMALSLASPWHRRPAIDSCPLPCLDAPTTGPFAVAVHPHFALAPLPPMTNACAVRHERGP